MSWWWREQRLPRAFTLTMEQRLAEVLRYWRAVDAGWEPAVPVEAWDGPHDPFSNGTPLGARWLPS